MDPVHQALIDRIMGLQQDGLTNRQISDHLNSSGVTSFHGKEFYPELVFGIIKKGKVRLSKLAEVVQIEDIKVWVSGPSGTELNCRKTIL